MAEARIEEAQKMAMQVMLIGVVAFGVGVFLVPALCDRLLKRKWAKHLKWWNDSLSSYRRWLEDHDGERPLPSASGQEGALGLWLVDSLRLARLKKLTKAQLRAMRDAGIPV